MINRYIATGKYFVTKAALYILYIAAVILGALMAFLSAHTKREAGSQLIGDQLSIGETVYADAPASTGSTAGTSSTSGGSCLSTGASSSTGSSTG